MLTPLQPDNPTPRTDAESYQCYDCGTKQRKGGQKDTVVVPSDFARTLECELNTANKKQHQSDLNYNALERQNTSLQNDLRVLKLQFETVTHDNLNLLNENASLREQVEKKSTINDFICIHHDDKEREMLTSTHCPVCWARIAAMNAEYARAYEQDLKSALLANARLVEVLKTVRNIVPEGWLPKEVPENIREIYCNGRELIDKALSTNPETNQNLVAVEKK